MNKKAIIVFSVVFIGILGLAACGGGQPEGGAPQDQQTRAEGQNGGEGQNKAPAEAASGVPVRIATVGAGRISDGILSTSVVEAEQSVDIYARVTGIVTRVNVEEGENVREGALLCGLEEEELRLTESKARAEMEKLKADFERTQTLMGKGIATETDLNNARYAYEQAEIGWKQAKTNLEFTQVKSTINGIVSRRLVRLGQKVDPSVLLYSLFNPRSLVVNVFVPESDYFSKIASRIQNIRAIITSESLPGVTIEGGIKRVSPVVDPQTNTIKVTINYDDPRNILRPGMYVRVQLITDTRENAILVPKTAILFDNNRQYIFLVRDGKAVRLNLEAGYSDTTHVQALSGVQIGDTVVVVGQNGLKDGSAVRIVTNDIEAAAPAAAEKPKQ